MSMSNPNHYSNVDAYNTNAVYARHINEAWMDHAESEGIDPSDADAFTDWLENR